MTAKAFISRGDRAGRGWLRSEPPRRARGHHARGRPGRRARDGRGGARLGALELCLPKPKAVRRGMVPVAVSPYVAAKLAVLQAFAEAGITKTELARRLGKDEKEVRRILDPRHATKFVALTQALRVLGKRLVVAVEKAA